MVWALAPTRTPDIRRISVVSPTCSPWRLSPLQSRTRAFAARTRKTPEVGSLFSLDREASHMTCAGTWHKVDVCAFVENRRRRVCQIELAYLEAKFDRPVSDPASRIAAAELIEEWRRRSTGGSAPLQPDDHFVRLLRVAKRRSGRAAAQKSPWAHRRHAIENVRATPGVRHSVPLPQQTEMRTGSIGREVHRAFPFEPPH